MGLDPFGGTVVLLIAGIVAMGVAGRLKMHPVIGFFAAGAVIGPFGLKMANPHNGVLHTLAELGVCFLLFDAGLHISITRLKARWRGFVVAGGLQMLAVGGLLTLAGQAFGLPLFASAIIGATLALSSTAIVLKTLRDENESDSPAGQIATEILIFQDLIGILLLVVIASLGSGGQDLTTTLLKTFGNIVLSVIFVSAVGRYLLGHFFRFITAIGTDEAFTASALLFVLCTCWLTYAMGLSMALGAFLAGVTLSECNYSYLVRTEITPFRGLLLSLFFLTVGMSLDMNLIFTNFPLIIAGTVLLMAIKIAGVMLLSRLLNLRCEVGTRLGFLLSQGSEFAFVILALCYTAQLLSTEQVGFLAALVGVSMMLSPLLGTCGCKLSRCVAKIRAEQEDFDAVSGKGEIIIVEMDEIGRDIASALVIAGIPYRGHDRDWERISYARSRGFNAHFSDPNRPRTLSRAAIGEVRAVVSLVEDDYIIDKLLEGLKKISAEMPIVGASREAHRLEIYFRHGVEEAFMKRESSAELVFESLLRKLNYPEMQIAEWKTQGFQKGEVVDGGFFPRASDIEDSEALAA